MPFNTFNLNIGRGKQNRSSGETQLGTHTYKSNGETLTTISGADYFPDFLGSNEEEVKIDDLITLKGSDGYQNYKITSLEPIILAEENISGNPFDQSLNTTDAVTFTNLDLTNLADDITLLKLLAIDGDTLKTRDLSVTQFITGISWVGAPAAPILDNISLTKVGSLVTLAISNFAGTAVNAAGLTATAAIPVGFRPAFGPTYTIIADINGVTLATQCNVNNGGDITIFGAPGVFAFPAGPFTTFNVSLTWSTT